jgi:hypothetical protein
MMELLMQHIHSVLASLLELTQYALPLQLAPSSFACLLAADANVTESHKAQERVRLELKTEWDAVLQLESTREGTALLQQLAPHTRYYAYRELMTCHETSHTVEGKQRLEGVVQAWHPPLCYSANIEECFNYASASLRKSTRSEKVSMANLQATVVRAAERRLMNKEQQVRGVELEAEDYEGREVRGLRASVWSPEQCPASTLSATSSVHVFRLA